MIVGSTLNAKMKPKVFGSLTSPPKRNSAPALLKSRILTNHEPTTSNTVRTASTCSTSPPITNCSNTPAAIRRQLTALRLLEQV